MAVEGAPAWAKGYEVAKLKRITALFKEHDQGMVHGAFGRYSELDAVADLERGSLMLASDLEWALVIRTLDRRTPIRDFTGAVRCTLEPGHVLCSRMAWRSAEGSQAIAAMLAKASPLDCWAWQEHPAERALMAALGLELAAVKITAASEMRGLWSEPVGLLGPAFSYPPEQALTLGRLRLPLPPQAAGALLSEVADLGQSFAAHYSSYNKRGSWTALALRGFYDDPERIEKPAEMNKKWRAENSDDLGRMPRDTALRSALPAAEALLAALPGAGFDRVRLMALAPGGGELERHADITDADAGASPGKLARIHIPLKSNPDVIFRGWDLDGKARRRYMAPGAAYYLDTRKPHTAINGGSEERIHLVADTWVDMTLVRALAAAEEADLGE